MKNLDEKISDIEKKFEYYESCYKNLLLAVGKKEKLKEERYVNIAQNMVHDEIDISFLIEIYPDEMKNQGGMFYTELRGELKQSRGIFLYTYNEIIEKAKRKLEDANK